MIFRNWRLVAAALSLLGLPTAAHAAPALWEVGDADSKVWLFGSFHLLPPDLQWRTELFDQALAAADNVYFETNVSPESQAGLMAETFRRGISTLGEKLTDSLNPTEAKTLIKKAKGIGVNIGALQAMRPWLATTTIAVAATVNAGYDPESGVDIRLQGEIPSVRQRFFETNAEQLAFLADAPQAEQVSQLVSTLGQLDELKTSMTAMLGAWSNGQPETLSNLFTAELAGDPAFTNRLIYDRNTKWVQSIKGLLANNEQDLIVVGAGHLLGDRSVVDLLGKAGFTVKRLQ